MEGSLAHSRVLEREAPHAAKGPSEVPGFGQVTGDRSKGFRSEPLLGSPGEGQSRTRLNSSGGASLKELGGLWAVVVVSSYLVPDLGVV